MSKLIDDFPPPSQAWKQIADNVSTLSDAELLATPEPERFGMLQRLIRIPPADIDKEPQVKTAISRLFLCADYPEEVQQKDRDIAQRFHERVNEWMVRLLAAQDETSDLVETLSYMAADAMGMDLSKLVITVAEESFSAAEKPLTQDFEGLASVLAHIDKDSVTYVKVALNTDHKFWTEQYPMTPWAMERLAASMLHEMSHVEQEHAMLDDDPSLFHATMYEIMRQAYDFTGIYEIYRSQLNERQCYYRQVSYLDIAQNWVPRPERDLTELDIRAHKNEDSLMAAMKEFLARARTLKRDPD